MMHAGPHASDLLSFYAAGHIRRRLCSKTSQGGAFCCFLIPPQQLGVHTGTDYVLHRLHPTYMLGLPLGCSQEPANDVKPVLLIA